MSYRKTRLAVEKLVEEELGMAIENNGDRFNSQHEAYAVILEEVDEMTFEHGDIDHLVSCLWSYVKENRFEREIYRDIEKHAVNAACEAIQVAAMARKAIRKSSADAVDA